MVEAFEESTHIWSHKIRTALMVKNLQRMTPELRAGVRDRAGEMLADLNAL